jgi:hypothetical protein
MKNPLIKDLILGFVDFGNYIATAMRLAREDGFGKVKYFCNWQSAYPKYDPYVVGYGVNSILPNFEQVHSIYEMMPDVDVWFFPDLYYGDMQEWLRDNGHCVFGVGRGENMELHRDKMKVHLKELGLSVNEWESIEGLDNLRNHLQEHNDLWVKTNMFRGSMESFHHDEYKLTKPRLDRFEHTLGVFKSRQIFIVEKPVNDSIDFAIDLITADGKYPKKSLMGVEQKNCYDDQTEVLTDGGWKLFKDLDKSELIFTLDISDTRHIRSEYQKPTDHICSFYYGDLISIEKESVSLMVTPNHNVLVADGIQNENAEIVNWPKRVKGDEYIQTSFKRGKRVLRLQQIKDVVDRNKRFSLLQPKHTYLTNKKRNAYISIGKHSMGKVMFARFMGIFLSEGYVRKRKNKNDNGTCYHVNISQYKYKLEVKEILNSMPFKWTEIRAGFDCYDSDLGEYLLKFGKAYEKYVPDWIKESAPMVINAFLDAYCLGDGTLSYKKKNIRKDSPVYNDNYTFRSIASRQFHTSSFKMANDLQELIVKVGNVAVSNVAKSYYNETDNCDYLMYVVSEKMINRKNLIFPKDINYTPYNGNVYCVTVPNSIIMIRRNGKSMWCGNSSYVGVFTDINKAPKALLDIHDKLSNTLSQYQYRMALSLESRITKDGTAYLLDPCCRLPEPPSSLYIEMYDNFPELVWKVANGNEPDIKSQYKYGVELVIKSEFSTKEPQAIYFPDEIKNFVKIKNLCIQDGVYFFIPQEHEMSEIGAVVAFGNSLKEAKKLCIERAKMIKGDGIFIEYESLDRADKDIEQLVKFGIKIF